MPRSDTVALTDRRPTRATMGGLGLAVAVMFAACSAGDGANSGPAASADDTGAGTTTTTSAAQALAAGSCPAVPASARPDPDRPAYRADLTADPATGQVRGPVTVTFTPDLPVDRLVVRLWANAPRQSAVGTLERVDDVRVDGRAATTSQPDPTTLVVDLDDRVGPGERVELAMDLALDVGYGARDRVDRSGDTLRLGSFLPLLAWVPGEGWAEDPPTALFAEAATTPIADFDVSLAVPAGYDVLATGVPDGSGRWQADAVRDFAASIGHFDLASTVVDAPSPVSVTVGVDRDLGESPEAYLDQVSSSLVSFSERFGPYPWPSLSLAVTSGVGGGIEMPMHLMQGPESVGRTTPHEVAHMWFYALVGNNQATDPWMDEALASYAEATFEESLDAFRARPQTEATEAALSRPLTYWADHAADYYTGVYVQGALTFADLGPRELVDCALRHYVAAQAYTIAAPADLLDALTPVFADASAALADRGVIVE